VNTFRSEYATGTLDESVLRGYVETFGANPSPNDYRSWPKTFEKLNTILADQTFSNCVVMLEVRVSSLGNRNKKADVILLGSDGNSDQLIIIEMKQWGESRPSETPGEVVTAFASGLQSTKHPAIQVRAYLDLLLVSEDECHLELDGGIQCHAMAWLFNMSREGSNALYDPQFELDLRAIDHHMYLSRDVRNVSTLLQMTIGDGGGTAVHDRLADRATFNASSLAAHANAHIPGTPMFTLVGEQGRANRQIQEYLASLDEIPGKHVIVVNGGPGSGKTAVAIEAIIEGCRKDHKVALSTTAKGLMTPLRKWLEPSLLNNILRYPMDFVTPFQQSSIQGGTPDDDYDLVIVDEAHRLHPNQKKYHFTHIRRDLLSGLTSAEEIVRSSRISVFIIDEDQIINPECTDTDMILSAAERYDANFSRFSLPYHFRGAGSSRYLDWLKAMMYPERSEKFRLNPNSSSEPMQFRIVDDPNEFLNLVQPLPASDDTRLVAGYCWQWTERQNRREPLPSDIQIINHDPGNGHPVVNDFVTVWEEKKKADTWALRDNGRNEVGCIYTIQGIDFNRVCVIWPLDLQWDSDARMWRGFPGRTNHSGRDTNRPGRYDNWDEKLQRLSEGEELIRYLQNVYYTLLSRANTELCVFFMDGATRDYFESWI
jgi:DUF2075 family protein